MPLILNGKLCAAMQFEAGLYPSSHYKKVKSDATAVVKEKVNQVLPDDIMKALQAIEEQAENVYDASKKRPF